MSHNQNEDSKMSNNFANKRLKYSELMFKQSEVYICDRKIRDVSTNGTDTSHQQSYSHIPARHRERFVSGILTIVRDSELGLVIKWKADESVPPFCSTFNRRRRRKKSSECESGFSVITTTSNSEGNSANSPTTGDWDFIKEKKEEDDEIEEAEEVKEEEEENSSRKNSAPEVSTVRPIELELSELISYRLSSEGNQLTLIQKDGTSSPPLIFVEDGPEKFLRELAKFKNVRKSASDESLYLLTNPDMDALDKSLMELKLFENQADSVWKFVKDIRKDPVAAALTGFAKLTDKLVFSPMDDFRQEDEISELLQQSLIHNHVQSSSHNVQVLQNDEDFEVVTSTPKFLENLPPRDSCKRGEALCQMDWELAFDGEGRLTEKEHILETIFRGGVSHEIRSSVWKFLLDFFPWDSTEEERTELRREKVDEYYKMKLQWKSISETQERNFGPFRERRTQIEKDVLRTDRTHPYYQGSSSTTNGSSGKEVAINSNLQVLHDILMTYVMYNFDLGYVQGMSDLLSPILYVMQNEVDAFWCFVGFMARVRTNFDLDQGGMKRQLDHLIEITKVIDPEFYSYLNAKESSNFYFCFRWLLIWFKREFNYTDVMKLWEVMWTRRPCEDNFHLLVCSALLHNERSAIMENKFGLTEILKHVNDMSFNIQLDSVLQKAEIFHEKLRETDFCNNPAIKSIFGGKTSKNGDENPEGEEEIDEFACSLETSVFRCS